jgi:hypothetical protein
MDVRGEAEEELRCKRGNEYPENDKVQAGGARNACKENNTQASSRE